MAFSHGRYEDLRGYMTYAKLMMKGTLSLTKTLITNTSDLVKLRKIRPTEDHCERLERRYELPEFSPGMKHCQSDEKYLPPTLYCNPRELQVIALAHQLGSYQSSDSEFA